MVSRRGLGQRAIRYSSGQRGRRHSGKQEQHQHLLIKWVSAGRFHTIRADRSGQGAGAGEAYGLGPEPGRC
jgi:hypothetical protein